VLAVGLVGGYALRMAHADGIPDANVFTYAGVVENSEGVPLTGAHDLEVALYAAATGGTALCTGVVKGQNVVNGQFEVAMPGNCVSAVQANKNAHVEVKVDGKVLPRSKVGAVPYAMEAGRAQEAKDADHASLADNATNATNATNASNATGALKTSLDAKAESSAVPIITDWANYPCVLSSGNVTVTAAQATTICQWRRVGGSVEIWFRVGAKGPIPNNGAFKLTFPTGVTKASSFNSSGGVAELYYGFAPLRTAMISLNTNDMNLNVHDTNPIAGGIWLVTPAYPSNSNDQAMSGQASFPVQGWTATK
jgi:hypothetical protein